MVLGLELQLVTCILNGDDDGIEFFGGTVNASNILVVNAKDDMFDFFTGLCRYLYKPLYGIREAGYLAVTSDPERNSKLMGI